MNRGPLCLLCLFLCATGAAAPLSRAADQRSSNPVEINIGKRGYLIPENYLGVVRPSRSAARHERAVLWILWPEMEPKRETNAHLWSRRLPKRQMRIHIEARGTETYDQLKNVAGLGLVDPEPEVWDYGLLRYKKDAWQFFVVSENARTTPQGRPLTFQCNDVPPGTREYFDVKLLCLVEYKLPDDAWVIVHFFLVNLEHWREIDIASRALLDRLRR